MNSDERDDFVRLHREYSVLPPECSLPSHATEPLTTENVLHAAMFAFIGAERAQSMVTFKCDRLDVARAHQETSSQQMVVDVVLTARIQNAMSPRRKPTARRGSLTPALCSRADQPKACRPTDDASEPAGGSTGGRDGGRQYPLRSFPETISSPARSDPTETVGSG